MARPPTAPAPVPVVALPVGRVDLKAVEEAQKKAEDELGNVAMPLDLNVDFTFPIIPYNSQDLNVDMLHDMSMVLHF